MCECCLSSCASILHFDFLELQNVTKLAQHIDPMPFIHVRSSLVHTKWGIYSNTDHSKSAIMTTNVGRSQLHVGEEWRYANHSTQKHKVCWYCELLTLENRMISQKFLELCKFKANSILPSSQDLTLWQIILKNLSFLAIRIISSGSYKVLIWFRFIMLIEEV